MAALPADLEAIARELDATSGALAGLANRLTDAQFTWQPGHDQAWSAAQCVEHLTKVATLYLAQMRPAVAAARTRGSVRSGEIKMSAPGRWFVASQEPPPRRRFKAPAKVRPGASGNRDDIMRAYQGVHRDLASLIEASAAIDVNATTFANPFFSLVRMRLGTGLRAIAAHERRHVWQAERVSAAAGFPEEERV